MSSDATTVLAPDCCACQALCCVVLPFERSSDFPESKSAGTACRNLLDDDRCGIHDRLRAKGWVGCTVFDCFGAGQRLSASVPRRHGDAAVTRVLVDAFPVVHQLHEMLWYLTDPAVEATRHAATAAARYAEVDALAGRPADELAGLDIAAVRATVAMVLRAVSDEVRGRAEVEGRAARRLPRAVRPGGDLVGAGLRGQDLRSAPLRGALMLGTDLRDADLRGADLLGTDLRGADLRGADLTGALFLTRPQAAAAVGDRATRLPERVARPAHWS